MSQFNTCLLCRKPGEGIICLGCDKDPRAWSTLLAWLDEDKPGSPAASLKLEALRAFVRRPGPFPTMAEVTGRAAEKRREDVT